MPFPTHIEQVLTAYGIRADTKAALYDLYVAMGDEVLEVFADIAETVVKAASLEPEDTVTIRAKVVERYLRRNHPRWRENKPTASLWHPREAEGRASGAAIPLREVETGILMLGRNAHSSGRTNTISFDIVARDLADAMAIGTAAGQQHTLPGSFGETSGTFDSARNVALIWEVQPNVYKPTPERNQSLNRLYRRHREWHRATLTAALEWLAAQKTETFVLRGSALAITHELNPAKPMSGTIAALHDRTVDEVVSAIEATLEDPTDADEFALLDSGVMNHSLRRHVLKYGANGLIYRIVRPSK